MNTAQIIDVILKIADKINEEKLFLTELDNVIGDGDHGINMARGFDNVKVKLAAASPATPSDVFKLVGMTLVSTVGGAAGPLYGTAFMNMAKTLMGKTDITTGDFVNALQSAVEGVSMRGKSKAGEKTMLDAMIPALDAIKKATDEGKNASDALAAGVAAAKEGVEFTKTIAATKGRASYVGDRSIGHQDPGATSFTMMLEVLQKAVG